MKGGGMKKGQNGHSGELSPVGAFSDRQHIAHVVRVKRRERGWTQSELAKAAGASRNWISAIESGRPVSRNMLRNVLAALGVVNPEGTVRTLEQIDHIETIAALHDAQQMETPTTQRDQLLRQLAIDHEEVQVLLLDAMKHPNLIDSETRYDVLTVLAQLINAARHLRATNEPEGVTLAVVEATRKTARIIKKMLTFAKVAAASTAATNENTKGEKDAADSTTER